MTGKQKKTFAARQSGAASGVASTPGTCADVTPGGRAAVCPNAMSYSFTKLFSSITDSSIWCENSDTRVVWVTMLAMADRQGRVFAALPGLAKRAAVSIEATQAAIAKFLGPDPFSRSKDFDGARISEIEGGWILLNYERYRALRDEESERERKRRWASENRQGASKVAHRSAKYPQAEAEADAERLNDERFGGNRSSLNRATEAELIGKCRELLGDDEMSRAGGHWRKNRVRREPALLQRALADLESSLHEGKDISNRGAYVEDLMKRWRKNK